MHRAGGRHCFLPTVESHHRSLWRAVLCHLKIFFIYIYIHLYTIWGVSYTSLFDTYQQACRYRSTDRQRNRQTDRQTENIIYVPSAAQGNSEKHFGAHFPVLHPNCGTLCLFLWGSVAQRKPLIEKNLKTYLFVENQICSDCALIMPLMFCCLF